MWCTDIMLMMAYYYYYYICVYSLISALNTISIISMI